MSDFDWGPAHRALTAADFRQLALWGLVLGAFLGGVGWVAA